MEQRKTKRSPIKKPLFLAIKRDLKDAHANGERVAVYVQQIATKHNVSPESVRTVSHAKSWPKFVECKKVKRAAAAAKKLAKSADEGKQLLGQPTDEVVMSQAAYDALLQRLDDFETDLTAVNESVTTLSGRLGGLRNTVYNRVLPWLRTLDELATTKKRVWRWGRSAR